MSNGHVFSGIIRRQEQYQFPHWIREGYPGLTVIFLQGPNNTGYIVTNIINGQRRYTNLGRITASIEIPNNNFAEAILGPVDHHLPDNTHYRIYLGLPDGRTFTGVFQ